MCVCHVHQVAPEAAAALLARGATLRSHCKGCVKKLQIKDVRKAGVYGAKA